MKVVVLISVFLLVVSSLKFNHDHQCEASVSWREGGDWNQEGVWVFGRHDASPRMILITSDDDGYSFEGQIQYPN